ncbi:APC family permease [Actinoplanes auranticolor]|uniref:Amino acid permease n=1 Tax=Actinoplanes auranticolor TaxID=47988 RepID=A0A919SIT6_9ACTN|nr:APC family permease [Actinoplanes auranticolor]GIM73192.1 amino acid permease [Actinoplanes auranticolor]
MPPPHPPAAGRLGGVSVVLLAVAVAAPAAVEVSAQPAVFLGVGLVLLVFATDWVAMARRMPHPGPLYGLVARGLGRPLGLGAAALTLLSYTAMQLALYATVGPAAAPLLADGPGITVAWWVVALSCWAIVAICGVLPARFVSWLIGTLVLAELVVIGGYGTANVLAPDGGGADWAALSPESLADVPRPVLGGLLVAAALAFAGFEITAVHAGQARHPRRVMHVCVMLLALLFAAASWAIGGTTPEGALAERWAPWMVTGLLAALIALHQVIVRHLVALGRERVLPAALGRRVPASAVLTVVAGAVIGGHAYAGAGISRWAGVAGATGILVLVAMTSLAALLFLGRSPAGEGLGRRFLAPGLSTIALGVLAHLAVADLRAVLAPAAAAILLGAGYGLALRRADPVRYAGIGLGGTAVVVTPSVPALPRQRIPGAHRPERVHSEELTG